MGQIWILISHLTLVANKTDPWVKPSVGMPNTWHPRRPLHSCSLGVCSAPIPELPPAEHPVHVGLFNPVLQATATNASELTYKLNIYRQPWNSGKSRSFQINLSLNTISVLCHLWDLGFLPSFCLFHGMRLVGLLGKLQIMDVRCLAQCLLQLEFNK